jgi:cyclic pyranopterin phosphate synthase
MLVDAHNRPIKDLRISVTDRCNFRCTYCMPLDEYEWIDKRFLPKISLLGFRQARGRKDPATGGEPPVRQDLNLVAQLSAIEGLRTFASQRTAHYWQSGSDPKTRRLKRVNISIDSLDAERFRRMTKRGDLGKVTAGIFAARPPGLRRSSSTR